MTGDPHKTLSCRLGRSLQTTAFVLLVACIAVRPFLQEMTYRTSPLPAAVFDAELRDNKDISTWQTDRAELARVTFAMLLLAAAAIWLLGAAMKKQDCRHVLLAALIVAFAAWAYFCAHHASDRRSAMDVWLEQVSLLAACWLAAQIFVPKGRFTLLMVVLAGVAAALAYKGIYEVTVELPETIRHFEMYGDKMGFKPGSSQAKMFESRLRTLTPTGFFALSNMYASAIIILLAAAAGLAMDKLIAARRDRRQFLANRKKGEVHLPTIAAMLSAAIVPALLAVLLLSRSRGGIAAGLLAVAAFVCVGVWRERLARHWRKAVAAAAAVFLLAVAATAAYGLKNDRLPTKTMTFRWYYWTGAAEIVRENPLWGAGPGNFSTAYLQHRRSEAEEPVKLPHNVIVHAAAQFGLPGGALYLLILAGVLVGICRPKTYQPPESIEQQPPRTLSLIIFIVLAMFAARMAFSNLRGDGITAMFNCVPALVLLIGLLVAGWAGGKFSQNPPAAGDISRIALACGLGGFVLHNMVEFGIWTPGTALLFWTSAGACLAQGSRPAKPAESKTLKFIRWPAAACGLAGVVLLLVFVYRPVAERFLDMEKTAEAARVGDFALALEYSSAAADADRLDPIAAADTAKLAMMVPPADKMVKLGLDYAKTAIARDPAEAGHYILAARIAAQIEPGSELGYFADAVSRDPQNMSNRLEYAARLAAAGRKAECLEQLDAIERIDAALLPESLLHLNDEQRAKINELRNVSFPAPSNGDMQRR